MKKNIIYGIFSNDNYYQEETLIGIFSTLEKAQFVYETYNPSSKRSSWIDEVIIDEDYDYLIEKNAR